MEVILINFHNMVYCAVAGCYNSSYKKNITKKIVYFRLPSDESLRRTWFSKIRRQKLPANYNSIRVCHINFEEDQFQRDLAISAPPGERSRSLLHVQRCYPKTYVYLISNSWSETLLAFYSPDTMQHNFALKFHTHSLE